MMPKPSLLRPRKGKMTVCIAALAQESKAIVCVSDTAISYGDTIQWDSDSTKVFELNSSGTLVLFAGSEELTSRVLGRVVAKADEIGDDIPQTRKVLEMEYREALQELIEARCLAPRLLSREDYIKSISQQEINPFIRGIADEVKAFVPDCALLVCGFDKEKRPFILFIDGPGTVTDMTITGFHSIGSGWEKSISKMLYSEHKKSHSIARVLFDTFDAKAFAEMSVGVGFNWDTWVITAERKAHKVPEKIDLIVEAAWADHDRSPFELREKDDISPPKNWKSQLARYCETIMPSASHK